MHFHQKCFRLRLDEPLRNETNCKYTYACEFPIYRLWFEDPEILSRVVGRPVTSHPLRNIFVEGMRKYPEDLQDFEINFKPVVYRSQEYTR